MCDGKCAPLSISKKKRKREKKSLYMRRKQKLPHKNKISIKINMSVRLTVCHFFAHSYGTHELRNFCFYETFKKFYFGSLFVLFMREHRIILNKSLLFYVFSFLFLLGFLKTDKFFIIK